MLNNKILLDVVIGSQAYGLATETSDVDRRGVYLESKEQIFGLKKAEPSHFEDPNDTIYPLKHFVSLLSKGNPNLIEMIFLRPEFIRAIHPLFIEYIIYNRKEFLSKTLTKSYLGYVIHQMHLVAKNGREKYSRNGYDAKAAMHMCRLFLQLENLIKFQDPIVYVPIESRKFLLGVREGEIFKTLEAFQEKINEWEESARKSIETSSLRDVVDYDLINDLLISFYEDIYI